MKKKKQELTEAKAKVNVEAGVSLPNELWIEIDDRKKPVLTTTYITAKTKQLKEFGYGNLTEDETKQQILNILNNRPLNIIGQFIVDEIVK